MTINYKFAKVKDTYAIYLCNKRNMPVYYNLLEYFYYILSNKYKIIIAKNNKKIIGYILLNINNNTKTHIMTMCVDVNFRKQNIATQLIKEVVNISKNKNYLSLYVHVQNATAIKCYRRSNFVINKIIKNYYKDIINYNKNNISDAYFMQKKLK